MGTVSVVRWYDPIPPRPALDRVLACSWTARPSGRHRLVPDACLDLVWLSTAELWLCGPETSAWTFQLSPGVESVGVRFRPGIAPPLWGFDASTILNRRISWRDVVGGAASSDLLEAIARAPDDHRRITAIENTVATRLMVAGPRAFDDVADAVLQRLAADPRARAGDIAAMCGLAPRQLLRRCQTAFGYGVSTLARIVRFHRFWSIVELSPPGRSFAALAQDAGYSDQAHLVHDCRAITGLAPRQFLAESAPTFPDMSDPYKTDVALVDRLLA